MDKRRPRSADPLDVITLALALFVLVSLVTNPAHFFTDFVIWDRIVHFFTDAFPTAGP